MKKPQFFVVDIRSADTITLVLNTAVKLPLDPDNLFIQNDSLYLYTTDHLIKFSQQALAKMAKFIDEDENGMVLNINGTTWPVPER